MLARYPTIFASLEHITHLYLDVLGEVILFPRLMMQLLFVELNETIDELRPTL